MVQLKLNHKKCFVFHLLFTFQFFQKSKRLFLLLSPLSLLQIWFWPRHTTFFWPHPIDLHVLFLSLKSRFIMRTWVSLLSRLFFFPASSKVVSIDWFSLSLSLLLLFQTSFNSAYHVLCCCCNGDVECRSVIQKKKFRVRNIF